jgi:hypothetical protein
LFRVCLYNSFKPKLIKIKKIDSLSQGICLIKALSINQMPIEHDRLAAARAAAKLKREKKAAAILARVNGKANAAEKRAKAAEELEILFEKERKLVLDKITKARKALGVHKNEDNPIGITRLIEQLKMESLRRIYGIQ